jgi:transposase
MTLSDVAELTLLSWDTVKNIVKTHLTKDYGKPFLKDVRYLGIDEIHLGKKSRYYTIVIDLEDGRILWAKPGRGGAALVRLRMSVHWRVEVPLWRCFPPRVESNCIAATRCGEQLETKG